MLSSVEAAVLSFVEAASVLSSVEAAGLSSVEEAEFARGRAFMPCKEFFMQDDIFFQKGIDKSVYP